MSAYLSVSCLRTIEVHVYVLLTFMSAYFQRPCLRTFTEHVCEHVENSADKQYRYISTYFSVSCLRTFQIHVYVLFKSPSTRILYKSTRTSLRRLTTILQRLVCVVFGQVHYIFPLLCVLFLCSSTNIFMFVYEHDEKYADLHDKVRRLTGTKSRRLAKKNVGELPKNHVDLHE